MLDFTASKTHFGVNTGCVLMYCCLIYTTTHDPGMAIVISWLKWPRLRLCHARIHTAGEKHHQTQTSDLPDLKLVAFSAKIHLTKIEVITVKPNVSIHFLDNTVAR